MLHGMLNVKTRKIAIVSVRIVAWGAFTIGFASNGIIPFLLGGLFVLSILLGVASASPPKNVASEHFFAWLLLLLFVGFISGEALDAFLERGNARAGDQLVEAIEKFQAAHRHYPEKLDDLAPEFIDAIPFLKKGFENTRFSYRSREDGFTLGYPRPGMMFYGYDSKKKQWRLRD